MMTAKIEGDRLIISVPISPRPSASGKTLVIASSNGNHATAAMHNGTPVIVGVNAYVPR
jgi:hypothetical protein